MYCPACGNRNPEGARFCTSCGQSLWQQPPQGGAGPVFHQITHVPNHLAEAIVATIFGFLCCGIPAGIAGVVSIVYATRVNGKVERGDIAGASRDSNKAKTWAWIAFGLALVSGLIIVLIFIAGIGSI